MEQTEKKKKDPNAYDAYLGEIQMVAFDYAPDGWAICDGSELKIGQYEALFNLIGTKYGGNGTTTFALPDLRSRIPVGVGQSPGLSNRPLGERAGVEKVTLTPNQIPKHKHPLNAITGGTETNTPRNNFLPEYTNTAAKFYSIRGATDSLVSLNIESIGVAGGSEAHENMPPYVALNYIICVQGIFPQKD